jgi:putative endonuclease
VTRARLELARTAEEIVASHLEAQGFEIVGRNVFIGRLELDLVARRGGLLVVCEVRARRSRRFGSPVMSIDAAKIAKVRQATAKLLRERSFGTREVRLDAAAVTFNPDGSHELEYFAGAL